MTTDRIGESASGKWLAAASGFLAVSLYVVAMAVAAPMDRTQPAAIAERGFTCPAERIMNRVELVFGTAKADAGVVSDPDRNSFLESEVTPRFPERADPAEGHGPVAQRDWQDREGDVARPGDPASAGGEC